MFVFRKVVQLFAIAAFILLISFLRTLDAEQKLQGRLRAGERGDAFLNTWFWSWSDNQKLCVHHEGVSDLDHDTNDPQFHSGGAMPPDLAYSRVMVVSRMKNEDIAWIANELPEVDTAIYIANDVSAPLHPPKNKGHEVMIYLTYIIDHYNGLPDIIIFMHAHRWTHHNNGILGHDAVEMIRRLSNDYVAKEGYVNLRCQWYPGCPEWLHPDDAQESLAKQEEEVLSQGWGELFPTSALPKALGQACCAQFALSKERIRSIPLGRYIYYRDWIMKTPLSNYVSGRIWEYTWQFLFTGQTISCPAEHNCYCDGFGVCFGGQAEYQDFDRLLSTKEGYKRELEDMGNRLAELQEGKDSGWQKNASVAKPHDEAISLQLQQQVEALDKEISARKGAALQRGTNPQSRTRECGRQ